tara:strand:- start:1186 stop:1983 length:798 start_codon:yes stop_codon:yes gene_type:complete
MSATVDITPLRIILGEHSESVWSDTELRSLLNTSNLTIWKIICNDSPGLVTFPYHFKLGNDVASVTMTDAVTSATDGIIAKSSGIGGRVSSILSVYETSTITSDLSSASWTQMKVASSSGQIPVFENSNRLFNDLELPDVYKNRSAVWDYGSQSLTIWPKPSKDHTYQVLLIPEAPIYIKTGATTERTRWVTESNSNDSELLGAERLTGDDGKTVAFHCHMAVMFDAAYQASFTDKSLRREFAAERDRLISLMATPATLSVDEAY